jgi:hypothetical protein
MVELAPSVTDMLKASSDGMSAGANGIDRDPISSSRPAHVATNGRLVRSAVRPFEDPRDEPHELPGLTRPANGMLAGGTARRSIVSGC